MAKQEPQTDLWVRDLLKEADIELCYQGSDIKEIDAALKSASKSQTGKPGYPEFCGTVKDFLIVIEDKSDISKHQYLNEKGVLSTDAKPVKDYALNGALHYGLHLVKHTTYKKILALGVSGNEKRHRITPIFINERGDYDTLADVETFISFSSDNIDEYYLRQVLGEKTDIEKETSEIIHDADVLHQDLRNYGRIKDTDKPLIVSGIMLALREIEHHTFSIDSLNGDTVKSDGMKIFEAIKSNLERAQVTPDTKRDKLLS